MLKMQPGRRNSPRHVASPPLRSRSGFLRTPVLIDPMQLESRGRCQTSDNRARSQAHRLLHKCTAELRKLQTERIYRNESLAKGTDLSNLGICDWASIEARLAKIQSPLTAGTKQLYRPTGPNWTRIAMPRLPTSPNRVRFVKPPNRPRWPYLPDPGPHSFLTEAQF